MAIDALAPKAATKTVNLFKDLISGSEPQKFLSNSMLTNNYIGKEVYFRSPFNPLLGTIGSKLDKMV